MKVLVSLGPICLHNFFTKCIPTSPFISRISFLSVCIIIYLNLSCQVLITTMTLSFLVCASWESHRKSLCSLENGSRLLLWDWPPLSKFLLMPSRQSLIHQPILHLDHVCLLHPSFTLKGTHHSVQYTMCLLTHPSKKMFN